MFTNTLDKKQTVIDTNGNEIVDLTTSIFSAGAKGLDVYQTVRLNSHYQMRPDKVAFAEYGTDEYTEYILKYSGVSNPFSLDEDDILFIPEPSEVEAQMKDTETSETNSMEQLQIYYKFTNKDFKSDSTSYDKLAEKNIPSGILSPEDNDGFMVPYISDQGTAITIQNGRMYFGTDAGNVATPEDYAQQLANALDEKCATNGMSMTDFVRASIVNAKVK